MSDFTPDWKLTVGGVDYQYLYEDGKWMYRCTYKGGWNELTAEVCK